MNSASGTILLRERTALGRKQPPATHLTDSCKYINDNWHERTACSLSARAIWRTLMARAKTYPKRKRRSRECRRSTAVGHRAGEWRTRAWLTDFFEHQRRSVPEA